MQKLRGAKVALAAAVGLGALLVVPGGAVLAGGPTGVTCGSIISAPGQYDLTGDCSGAGITIMANNVHLNLDGYTMTGTPSTDGIDGYGVSGLVVKGPGTITAYGCGGVNFYSVANSLVNGVTVTADGIAGSCSLPGMFRQIGGVAITASNNVDLVNVVATANGKGMIQGGSTDIHYDNVTSSGNLAQGIHFIAFDTDSYIDGSTTDNNGLAGIAIGDAGTTGNHIDGNTAVGNLGPDLDDDNAGCGSDKWHGNHFTTANQPCIS
jgi:hypothetical protein